MRRQKLRNFYLFKKKKSMLLPQRMQVKTSFVFSLRILFLFSHPTLLYMNVKGLGFSNRHLVVGEEGVKGKVLCMAFHMLMDRFHDNH